MWRSPQNLPKSTKILPQACSRPSYNSLSGTISNYNPRCIEFELWLGFDNITVCGGDGGVAGVVPVKVCHYNRYGKSDT